MKFPQAFLDEIRSRLAVSEVVGVRVKLKRAGKEWKGISPFQTEKTPSFFVNDQKQFWHDFSSGKHGDVFSFLMETEGCDFPEAVSRLAQQAGLPMPQADPELEQRSLRRGTLREITAAAAAFYQRKLKGPEGKSARGYLADRGIDPSTAEQFGLGFAPDGGQALKQHLLAEGAELEDLEEAGLVHVRENESSYTDRFIGRVMFPILDLQGRPIAFGARAMREGQQPKYLNTTDTPIFQKGEHVYNAPAARKAAYAGHPLRVVEGYTDVIAMVSAGHPATVATLGTAVTEHQLGMLWKWSAEPTFCLDGDEPGQRAQAKVIDLALPGLGDGRSVQFVTFPAGEDPDSLVRGDGPEALAAVLDAPRPLADALWTRELAQGPTDTPERCEALQGRLRAAVGLIRDKAVRGAYGKHFARALGAHFRGHEVPGWHPGTQSKFGRISWRDQDLPVTEEYSWWIKGIIPKNETIAVVGQTQTGKSFETFNIVAHIAQGIDYRGCRTEKGLAIICAMEGGKGFRDRMRGYRKHHNLPLDLPLEVLTRRADLFGSETDIRDLIAEIQAIAAEHELPLAVVVIDTYSAATPGLKENASEDISRVRKRLVAIQEACHCSIIVVDHTNATGEKVRGHTSKTADIETQLDITWHTRMENRHPVQIVDDDGREIRRITVRKQREGKAGQHWDFVLKAIEVRKDADGDPVTTCVSCEPARSVEDMRDEATGQKQTKQSATKPGYFKLNKGETTFFKALLRAVESKGTMPPQGADVPPGVPRVVTWEEVKVAYLMEDPNDEGDNDAGKKKYANRIKVALRRAREALLGFNIIGIAKLPGETGGHIAWPTGRRVYGPGFEWPPALRAVAGGKANDPAALAPGETMEDLLDGFGSELPPE